MRKAAHRRYRSPAVLVILLAAFGCAGSNSQLPAAAASKPVRLCEHEFAAKVGVTPVRDKTGKKLGLEGSDDLLSAALVGSGCFTVVERDRVAVLIEEMKLCDASNPDKDYFDCDSFAKKGKLLGLSHLMFGDLIFAEDDVEGAQLVAKFPGVGGIEIGRRYSAMFLSLRIVEVETGKVVASEVTRALVPADKGGFGISSPGGFDFRASAEARTPFGDALRTMIDGGVAALRGGFKS